MEPALKRISPFIPQYWLCVLFIGTRRKPFHDQVIPLIILILFAILFFALQGVIAHRKQQWPGVIIGTSINRCLLEAASIGTSKNRSFSRCPIEALK
jgi:hypothetical protein